MIEQPASIRRAPGRGIARLLALVSVVVSVGMFWRVFAESPDTEFDDSYMTLRYAKNVVAGHGFAWNPGGPQVLGATSLLHCAVLTGGYAALGHLSDSDVLKILSAGAGLAAVLLMAVGCACASRSEYLRGGVLLWAGLLSPMLLFNSLFRYHSLTGMDTTRGSACDALLVGLGLRAAYKASLPSLVATVVVGYAAYLARPDSGLYVALFPALAIFFLGPREKRVRQVILFWGIMGGVLAIDAAVKILVFGDPVPLSFYMKSHALKTGYAGLENWNAAAYFTRFSGSMLPFACAAIVLVNTRNARLLIPFAVPFLLTMAYLFTTVQVMGFRARFYLPSLPFVVMAVAMLLDDQTANGEYTFRIHPMLTRLILVLLVVAGFPIAAYQLTSRYTARATSNPIALVEPAKYYTHTADEGPPQLEWWDSIVGAAGIANRLPDGATFALTELGLVAASAPHVTIIDPTGLHDPHFAHNGFSAEEFLDRKPDLVWLPHPHYVAMLRSILETDRFWQEYELYGGMLNFGVAVRKDGEHAGVIRTLIYETWNRTYPALDIRSYRAARIGGPADS